MSAADSCEAFSEKVTTSTLDDLSARYGCPSTIKIDTEGFSNEVLSCSEQTLANPVLRAFAIETFRFAEGLTPRHLAVERKLAEFGFHPYAYEPKARTLRQLRDPLEGRQDTLYLRPSDQDLALIRSSDPIKVMGLVF
jgi:hypothetical protein